MAPSVPLQELPLLPDIWELCLFPPRPDRSGPKLRAMLLVAEVGTKRMRLTWPVRVHESCGEALREALLRPDAGATPGRPRGLRVLDPALLQELQPVLTEARVLGSVVPTLPALMESLAGLMHQAGAPVGPGLSVELDAWRRVLPELVALAPWASMPRGLRFLFRGGGLDGQVATLIGGPDQTRGMLLYPSIADFDLEERRWSGPLDPGLRRSTLSFEHPTELTEAERAAGRERRLIFQGPLFAKAYGTHGARFPPLSEVEQHSLRVAAEGVLGILRLHGSTLRGGGRCKALLAIEGAGSVEVEAGLAIRPYPSPLPTPSSRRSVPADPMPTLTEEPVRLSFTYTETIAGRDTPAPRLTIELSERAAKAAALTVYRFAKLRLVRRRDGGERLIAELIDGSRMLVCEDDARLLSLMLKGAPRFKVLQLQVAPTGTCSQPEAQRQVLGKVMVPLLRR